MDWKEEEKNQKKECLACGKPILLKDWLARPAKKHYKCLWDRVSVCLDFKNSKCNIILREKRLEEARPVLDMSVMSELLGNVRESLGVSETQTPSSFDGWDLCITHFNLDKHEGYNDALRELLVYSQSVKRSHGLYFRRSVAHLMDDCGLGPLLYTLATLYPEEFQEWPLWALPSQTRKGLIKQGIVAHTDVNYPLLFDRMKEKIFPEHTYDDMLLLSSSERYKYLYREHRWLPSLYQLLYGDDSEYDDMWGFVYDFQRHVCRDEGRFTTMSFTQMDYLTMLSDQVGRRLSKEQCRQWFFDYLCRSYSLDIDTEKFPYESTNYELEQVINLSADDINSVSGIHAVRKALTSLGLTPDGRAKVNGASIRWLVSTLWPDYEMEHNLWNRMLVSEKRMNSMLSRVFTYCNIHDYVWHEALMIPTKSGKVARYRHSNMPVRVDGMSQMLGFIAEGQGDYHYIDHTNAPVETWDGYNWDNRIPACYDGKMTTGLGYKQEQDAKKRRTILRHGFSPIYIILSNHAHAVKGVHGDIPQWNRNFITGRGKKRIGLAETFDMQGREDIGDMIRRYYNEVVLA